MLSALRQFIAPKEREKMRVQFSAKNMLVEDEECLCVAEIYDDELRIAYSREMDMWCVAQKVSGQWMLTPYLPPDAVKALCLLPNDPHDYFEVQQFLELDVPG